MLIEPGGRERVADMLGFEVARNEPQPLWWAQVELIPATVGWLPSEATTCRVSAAVWLETGPSIRSLQDCPLRRSHRVID